MTITAGTITQYEDLDSGKTMQNVPWTITDGDTVLFEGNQSFDLTATADEIRSFLTQCLQTHTDDVARSSEAAERQAQLDQAASVSDEISGLSINA